MKETRANLMAEAIRKNERFYYFEGRKYNIDEIDVFMNRWGQFVVIGIAMVIYYIIEQRFNLKSYPWYYGVGIAVGISFAAVTLYIVLYNFYVEFKHNKR
ncbi:MAG TPA: hypothetical protein PLI19_01585 [Erysipelotrichaceae bacterium]|nr:hypothetical protein [Erysipelotrichaceae bacterium]HQB32000.1 hypothetical protein [Erysipelotrichaceae bacterium]